MSILSQRSRVLWSGPVLVAAVFGTSWACTNGSADHGGVAPVTVTSPATKSPTSEATSASPSLTTNGASPVASSPLPDEPSTTPTPLRIDSSIAVYANCTMPVAQQRPTVEPAQIDMACADNGFGIKDIRWTSWMANSATGSGTTWYKDCKPNCAEGKIVDTPNVQITLTAPVRGASGELVWSQIAFSALPPGYRSGPQALPTRPD